MACVFIFLLLFIGVIGLLVFFACRRISRHVSRNPEAARHIIDHVVLPVILPPPEQEQQQTVVVEGRPELRKITGATE